jgi:alpha 1,3-glucosidase
MKYDPYTLVVTVDRQGRAKGELYVDDGESYEYKNGKYILQQFTFDGKVLSGINQVKPSGEKYEKVSVEKIIFIGLNNKSKQAMISQDGQQWTAEIQAQNGETIIRNPRMQIGSDWTVEL